MMILIIEKILSSIYIGNSFGFRKKQTEYAKKKNASTTTTTTTDDVQNWPKIVWLNIQRIKMNEKEFLWWNTSTHTEVLFAWMISFVSFDSFLLLN